MFVNSRGVYFGVSFPYEAFILKTSLLFQLWGADNHFNYYHYHSYHYQVRCAGNHGGVPSGSVRDVSPVHRRRYHPGHIVSA